MNKLQKYIRCTAVIEAKTGIHIGGQKEGLKIGGIDNPIIRNPITKLPYIPGSSLKGRFRSALELKYNDVFTDPKGNVGPSQDLSHNSKVVKLFGSGNPSGTSEATRLIFRDANLLPESEDYAEGEIKGEVKMDRKKLAAFSTGPRQQERVPAGAQFGFEVMIRIFEGDDENVFKEKLLEAMKIVELEYLGGSGTRGYGQVIFKDQKFEDVAV